MKVHAESVMFLLMLQFCLLSMKRNVSAAEASLSGFVLLGKIRKSSSAELLLKGAGRGPWEKDCSRVLG